MDLLDETKYLCLEPILHEVNSHCVKMDKNKSAVYQKVAREVVKSLIDKLRDTNTVFKAIFQRLDFVGSYYDGLRVKEATEFDINIIVKLPLHYNKINVANTNATSGFVSINISEAKTHPGYVDPVKKVVEKWCDKSGYLQPKEIRSWLESAFSKTVSNSSEISIDGKSYKYVLIRSELAFTAKIFWEDTRIDVDLVIALEFPPTLLPPGPIRCIPELASSWIVVPKQPKLHYGRDILWRISFPTSEKKLLNGLLKMKFINRIMKALRDHTNLNLPSYYIKVIFLWEAHAIVVARTESPKYWEKNTGYLFVYALRKMQNYLSSQRLPWYWHKGFNLFQHLQQDNAKNMANHINKMIKKIHFYIESNDTAGLKSYTFKLFNVNTSAQLNETSEQSNESSESPGDRAIGLIAQFASWIFSKGNS